VSKDWRQQSGPDQGPDVRAQARAGGEPSGPEPIPWHVSQPGIIGRAARPTDQGMIDIAITFQMLGADKVSRMTFGFRR